jgi:hypothetical protein
VKGIQSGGEEQRMLLGAGAKSSGRMVRMGRRGRGRSDDVDIDYEGHKVDRQRAEISARQGRGRGRGQGAGRVARGRVGEYGGENKMNVKGSRFARERQISALAPAARPSVTVREPTSAGSAGAGVTTRGLRTPPGGARDQR